MHRLFVLSALILTACDDEPLLEAPSAPAGSASPEAAPPTEPQLPTLTADADSAGATADTASTDDTGWGVPTGPAEVVTCAPERASCATRTVESDRRDPDLPVRMTFETLHDPCGLPIAETKTTAVVGSETSVATHSTYDEDHFLVSQAIRYKGATVVPDETHTYTYDALRLLDTIAIDYQSDGTIDATHTYTYDAARRRVYDVFAYGSVVTPTRYRHTGDATVGTLVTDTLDDGVVDRAEGWDLTTGLRWADLDGDGTFDEEVQQTLDRAGQPLETVTLDPSTGEVTQRATFTYDAAGRPLGHTLDLDDDGTVEIESNTTWDCP